MRILCLTILLNILLSPLSYAELYPKQIKFQHMLEKTDLVLGEVRSMLQDSEGFIWLGGWNALVRYDGLEFKEVSFYTHKNGEAIKTPINQAMHMIEDRNKLIWISTSHGVYTYNPKIDLAAKIKDNHGESVNISETFCGQMLELPSGDILVSSYTGVFLINAITKDYSFIGGNKENPFNESKPSHLVSKAVHMTEHGDIWIGTNSGIDKYDWQNRTFKHTQLDVEGIGATSFEVRDIESVDHILWIATSQGLVRMNSEDGTQIRFSNTSDPTSLGSNDVWDVLKDSRGRIWVSLDKGGLNLYDESIQGFRRYTHKSAQETSLSSDVVRTAMEDNTGDLWVAVYPEGIDFFNQSSTSSLSYTHDVTDKSTLSFNSVLSISEDSQGNFWVGTDGGGLNYFDSKTDKFTTYRHDPENKNSISSDAILSSLIDSEGILWLGTWAGGVTSYDAKSKTFTQHPFGFPVEKHETSKVLNSGHVWSIFEDSEKTLWFGTHTGGLSRLNRKTGEYTHYWETGEPGAIASGWVWTIFEDSKNNFWVGTSKGLNLMDRSTGEFKHYAANPDDPNALSEAYALSIFEDSKNRLWIGTNAGLNLFDYEKQTFSRITKADGLFDDSIRSIVEDGSGLLWLGTANGVSSYDPETNKIKNYNRESGKLIGGFFYNGSLRSSTGDIVFGGVNGLRIYKPYQMKDNLVKPPVVFTNLQVNSEVVEIGGDDALLENHINYTNEIVLDHHKSMFVIRFAALNFRDSSKNQYEYMLEGFDTEWQKSNGNQTAKYTNLDAGEYVFKVKASNNDGIWNEAGRSIKIIQLPAPWLTWWAYCIYATAFCLALAIFYHNQRRKNKILESMVYKRTEELYQKSEDVRSMLCNMEQGLFTIDDSLRVDKEYSQFLETIFETQNLAGLDAIELLFAESEMGKNAINQIKEALKASIGEEDYIFDFNQHLLVSEYSLCVNNKIKTLAIDWNPILENGHTFKVMVSVRDISLQKQAEHKAAQQQRELEIISQLISIPDEKFIEHERTAKNYVNKCIQFIHSVSEVCPSTISELYRNMHTLKGNCRVYGFSFLCDKIHDVETTYSEVRDNDNAKWEKSVLLTDLHDVEKSIEEYSHVFRDILGKGTHHHSFGSDGLLLDATAVTKLKSLAKQKKYDAIVNYIEDLDAMSLEGALEDVVNAIPSISKQLDKVAPAVSFNAGDIKFKKESKNLLNDIFSHIFRNSLDHGIECTAERLNKNKPAQGTININALRIGNNLSIYVRDDGRGMDLKKLHQQGVKLGLWTKNCRPSKNEIASLIYHSGLSTKDTVSDISGRGVGLDAVKNLLNKQGGDIQVLLPDCENQSFDFAPFELVINLPSDQFYCNAA